MCHSLGRLYECAYFADVNGIRLRWLVWPVTGHGTEACHAMRCESGEPNHCESKCDVLAADGAVKAGGKLPERGHAMRWKRISDVDRKFLLTKLNKWASDGGDGDEGDRWHAINSVLWTDESGRVWEKTP